MKTPLEVALFITAWEALRLQRYRDAAGFWTIGYGHKITPADGEEFSRWVTRERAVSLFLEDLAKAEKGVLRRLSEARAVPEPLPDLCFGALVSLAYNTGADGLGEGLLAAVRDDPAAVPGWLVKYNKSGGKVLPGLVERRAAEAAMWERGMRA